MTEAGTSHRAKAAELKLDFLDMCKVRPKLLDHLKRQTAAYPQVPIYRGHRLARDLFARSEQARPCVPSSRSGRPEWFVGPCRGVIVDFAADLWRQVQKLQGPTGDSLFFFGISRLESSAIDLEIVMLYELQIERVPGLRSRL